MYAGHFDFTRPLIGTIPALWTRDECEALLARERAAAWPPATVNAASGRVVAARLRYNDVAIVLDDALAGAVLRSDVIDAA